ncbi:MAG: hypothetical protein AAF549_06000 [Pseudomonadota bacterium]
MLDEEKLLDSDTQTFKKPRRVPLHRVFILRNKLPALLLDNSVKGGEPFTPDPVIEAITNFFTKDVDQSSRHLQLAYKNGLSVLAELFPEIAESKVSQARQYVASRVPPSIVKIITFHHEKI